MKITGGKLKNRNFFMPEGLRATQNVVRKAIFDIVGQDFEGITFLELYAGSGAVGLEAYSRGAKNVIFVEKDHNTFSVLEKNLDLFKIFPFEGEQTAQAFNTDISVALSQLERYKKKFDVIFMDPPYGEELAKKALKTLEACDILQPNCLLIVQHEDREELPPEEGRLERIKHKFYGGTTLSIYKIKAS